MPNPTLTPTLTPATLDALDAAERETRSRFDWQKVDRFHTLRAGCVDDEVHRVPREWCVVRFIDDGFGDEPRTPGEYGHILSHGENRSVRVSCEPLVSHEESEPATFATVEEAQAIAREFPQLGRGREHYAAHVSTLQWRVLLRSSYDGSCRAVYEGGEFIRAWLAFSWARGRLVANGERRPYLSAHIQGVIHRDRLALPMGAPARMLAETVERHTKGAGDG